MNGWWVACVAAHACLRRLRGLSKAVSNPVTWKPIYTYRGASRMRTGQATSQRQAANKQTGGRGHPRVRAAGRAPYQSDYQSTAEEILNAYIEYPLSVSFRCRDASFPAFGVCVRAGAGARTVLMQVGTSPELKVDFVQNASPFRPGFRRADCGSTPCRSSSKARETS